MMDTVARSNGARIGSVGVSTNTALFAGEVRVLRLLWKRRAGVQLEETELRDQQCSCKIQLIYFVSHVLSRLRLQVVQMQLGVSSDADSSLFCWGLECGVAQQFGL